jgi:hypothetical protein
MRKNRLKDTFSILQHLVVPKAKHLPPLAFQIGVTGLIARALSVLRAVSLDDELSANAKKVDNVRSYRNLSAKLDPAQPTIAQQAPQAKLGVGRRGAHRSSARALVRRDASVGLHRSSIRGKPSSDRLRRPPSPRGRRELRDGVCPRGKAPFGTPSPSGIRWSEGPDEGAWLTTL